MVPPQPPAVPPVVPPFPAVAGASKRCPFEPKLYVARLMIPVAKKKRFTFEPHLAALPGKVSVKHCSMAGNRTSISSVRVWIRSSWLSDRLQGKSHVGNPLRRRRGICALRLRKCGPWKVLLALRAGMKMESPKEGILEGVFPMF